MQRTHELSEIAADCTSIAQVVRKLGLPVNGANYKRVGDQLRADGVDTSHFTSRHGSSAGRPAADVLVVRQRGRERAVTLRRAMREVGVPYVCALCSQAPHWNGLELTLQVDHVNGDYLDCRIDNLRFLCPNCHTQTDTYSRRLRPVRPAKGFMTPERAAAVREAWKLRKAGDSSITARGLAEQYGVSKSTIYHIVEGRKWTA